MSAPIVSAITEAAGAGKFPLRFGKRERKIIESVKAYADSLVTVKPAFVVVAAGTQTTPGGSASVTITVAGALSTDVAFVVLKTVGGTPRTVLTASAASGQINVVMSGDPSTDHVLSYQLIRANA